MEKEGRPDMAIQSATKENLKTFLSNIYYIPMNQREYSWEQAQLEDFWEDFKSVINNQDRKHFFGQIVIYDDNKKKKKCFVLKENTRRKWHGRSKKKEKD